jgi:hypothetical protein
MTAEDEQGARSAGTGVHDGMASDPAGEPSPAEPQPGQKAPAPAAHPVKGRAQGVLSVLALAALVASAAVGGNLFGLRDTVFGSDVRKPKPPAVSRLASGPSPTAAPAPVATDLGSPATTARPAGTLIRSQPWWQAVTTLEGTGTTTAAPFTVDAGAVQWRVKWTCQGGHLLVRAPGRARPVVDGGCPGTGTGYVNQSGAKTLQVDTDGPWRLQVDQQVDVPLVEPPLPAMTAAGSRAVAGGSFYNIDQSGTGRVTLYRLADGSYALRLDDFYTTPNVELELRMSSLPAPHTTDQYSGAPSSDVVAALDVTAGNLNFALPRALDPGQYHSVVVWCPLIHSAYAAATLTPIS